MPLRIGPKEFGRRLRRPAWLSLTLSFLTLVPFQTREPATRLHASDNQTPRQEDSTVSRTQRQGSPGDGWVAFGCHWNLSSSVFTAQGFLTVAKAYYDRKTFRDFTFEVRMAKIAENGAIGVLFRYDERQDEGYEIHLWPSGGFAVAKFWGPRKQDFAAGPPSHFNRELNTWNTVKVVGRGERFDIFINGFHVCTARDAEFRKGKLGLLMPGDARQRAKFHVITMTGDI